MMIQSKNIYIFQAESPCKALNYAVKRLIKGLGSDRKWARLGFSLALAQVRKGV